MVNIGSINGLMPDGKSHYLNQYQLDSGTYFKAILTEIQ